MAHHKFPPVKTYELIEHTADIGIKLQARSLKQLFKNAALAMFDIMAERKPTLTTRQSPVKQIIIKLKADNPEELLVSWLNELLFLSATKEAIFSDFQIKKINGQRLQAVVKGQNIKNYKVNTEIKAATYHELKIEENMAGWQVQIIFDV